jgi:hypothetical protein
LVFASARQEHSRSISGWHVEGAALCVVDVLAIVRVRYGIITGLEAELAASEETAKRPRLDMRSETTRELQTYLFQFET